MPYIDRDRRGEIKKIKWEQNESAETPGELNFLITVLLTRYMRTKGLSYQTINDIIGALEGAKMEFYRRVAVPYENEKLSTNGDVY